MEELYEYEGKKLRRAMLSDDECKALEALSGYSSVCGFCFFTDLDCTFYSCWEKSENNDIDCVYVEVTDADHDGGGKRHDTCGF